MRTFALVLAFAAAAPAQEWIGAKDFLTPHEVGLIREAQEPNARIETYLHFAALRLELVDQLLAKDEPGRGAKIHQSLSEYGRILEAVDMVIDDALLRDVDLSTGLAMLVERQGEFLGRLERIDESEPADLWRYEFVLEDAREITVDSLDLASGESSDRKRAILESDSAGKAAREAAMSDTRRKEVEKARDKQESRAEEAERKRPSLLKKGETPGGQGAP